jgi:hypothetical protein
MNGAGVEIWRQIEAGSAPPMILQHLAGVFGGEPARFEADLSLFIQTLRERGLIHEAG